MIKTATIRVQLKGLELADAQELMKLLGKLGRAMQLVHEDIAIDPKVEVLESARKQSATLPAAGSAETFMEVRRASGVVEHLRVTGPLVNGVCVGVTEQISQEQYDAHHATPEGQANLESARSVVK